MLKKSDVVKSIAEKSGLKKDDAAKALNAFTDTIIEALAHGEEVQIMGFGSFRVTERDAREGVNPHTGEKIQIAASKSPRFKAGKTFRDAVSD